MQLDDTLLKMDRVPTDEELKAFFRAHDFTTAAPLIDRDKITNEQAKLRDKVRKLFRNKWLEQMQNNDEKDANKNAEDEDNNIDTVDEDNNIDTEDEDENNDVEDEDENNDENDVEINKKDEKKKKKKSFINFTNDYPIKLLADTDANFISDAVLKIVGDEELSDIYADAAFQILENPLIEALSAYMKNEGKNIEAITEKEFKQVFDHVADDFLGQMVGHLQAAQGVPELSDILKTGSAHEDFNFKIKKNFSAINFERDWGLERSHKKKVKDKDKDKDNDKNRGTPPEFVGYDNMMDADTLRTASPNVLDLICGENPEDIKAQKLDALRDEFIPTLSEVEQAIIRLRTENYTQTEIAAMLGYKTQGAISKRLDVIRKKAEVFIKSRFQNGNNQ